MNDIRLLYSSDEIANTLPSQQELVSMTAAVFGALSGGFEGMMLTTGRLVQALWTGRLWPQFLTEVHKWKEEGKIKEDYFSTSQNWEDLTELLDYLDRGIPNERVWEVLKKIYVISATETNSSRNDRFPFYYLQVIRNLSAGEIEVMFAAHRIAQEINPDWLNQNYLPPQGSTTNYWIHRIEETTQLKQKDLIEKFEDELIQKRILSQRTFSDRSGINLRPHFHLSKLGYSICEYVAEYDELKHI